MAEQKLEVFRHGGRMPGESELHRTLKKQACYWLHRQGYRAIAAEVKLPPLGIVDAVGAGLIRWAPQRLRLAPELHHVCIIECKASRADFLRDCGGQEQMLFELRAALGRGRRRRPPSLRNIGKFRSCLLRPMANLHYVLAPAGLLHKADLPPRWGLLALGEAGITVVVRAAWIDCAHGSAVESAIARTLTADIYNADARAVNSVNREVFLQQQSLAGRIRGMRPRIVLAAQG
jgi:hypothetical protein